MDSIVPLKDAEYQADYENRINPTLMTGLLHKSVPVLEHAGWKITEVAPGYTESLRQNRIELCAARTT